MDWLNYHHLLYFWTVAREGSVSRAAEVLHLRQPTVSAQIRTLEKSLGQSLFVKRGRNLVLTEQGQLVFRYADEIFGLGRELLHAVRGSTGDHSQRFSVGISDSLPKLTTYRLLEPALHLDPPMRLFVRVDKTDRLLTDLATHGLDLVLTDAPMPPGSIRAFNHLLGECGVTVFGTATLARRHRDHFPESLHDAPMLLPTRNTALRHSLEQWFETCSIVPRIMGEVEDAAILQVLGQHGLGLFAAPSVVEEEICHQYRVQIVGRLERVRERFYGISAERRLRHPAVVAISEAARRDLFAALPGRDKRG
jgi:LysR family transcriptional activator of nhaA